MTAVERTESSLRSLGAYLQASIEGEQVRVLVFRGTDLYAAGLAETLEAALVEVLADMEAL